MDIEVIEPEVETCDIAERIVFVEVETKDIIKEENIMITLE